MAADGELTMKMRKYWGLAGMAAVSAIIAASSAAAEVIVLECDVGVQSVSDYRGGGTETEPPGPWRIRLDTERSEATVELADSIFVFGSLNPLVVGTPVPLTSNEEEYLFCLSRSGSCNREASHVRLSYTVDRARIDRRRGDFSLSVDINYHEGSLGRHDYRGTCRRAPEQQF